MTKVVNLRHDKYEIYIGRGRGSIFGNPFVIGIDGTREEVIEKYRVYFNEKVTNDINFKKEVLKLKNKILGCFCAPLKCHGSIAEIIEKHF